MTLPFGELEPGPRTALAVFLSFLNPWIALDESGFFQRNSKIRVGQYQGPGDTMPHCAGLTGDTAADHSCFDIIGPQGVGNLKRMGHFIANGLNRKKIFYGTIVDGDLTAARF